MNLADARDTFADALNTAPDVNVRARGPLVSPKAGDGWVTLGRIEPSDYVRSRVVLTALVSLGQSAPMAEELLDTWAVALLDAATTAEEFPVMGAAVEPLQLVLDSGATMYALTVQITTEVCQ